MRWVPGLSNNLAGWKNSPILRNTIVYMGEVQLPKMNVSRFAISLSKTALLKRDWQTLKVLPSH